MENVYVINDSKLIFKVDFERQLDSKEYGLLYRLELVAGYDYVNADENDLQGFVGASRFIDDVQLEHFTVYPMDETIKDRLIEEGYTLINIKDYKIFASERV